MSDDYRQRLYARYATRGAADEARFDAPAAACWGRAYDYYLRDWLPKDKNAAIADLACGSGGLLYFFKQREYMNLHGVDVSPSQIKLAREVAPQAVEGDVFGFLGASAGRFDLITGFDIVEHFQKDEVLRFLDACRNALKPGGRLVLQTPNAESPWGGALRYGDFTHEVCFQPGSLAWLLNVCGYEQAEPREACPVPWGYSAASTVRYAAWCVLRSGLKAWNRIETGAPGSGVFTRVFLMSARRPAALRTEA